MHRLAARPHHLGSPGSKANAEYIAELFRSWGYQVAIEEFQALFPTPTERRVEMIAPRKLTASLVEDPLREDSTSGQTAEQLPTFNAYSIDGDVTAEVVYVNYGVPEDYEELARRGIDVKGKIALARYGRSWRGIKPKVAAEHGAVGCLIFSDPAEDGYGAGDAYPLGGFRPSQGAQRGSVVDMPVYSGDPLTPGVGATKDAKRLDRSQLEVLTKIPVLPISARDAQPMLENLGGPVVPAAWRGALPVAYHFGPGPAKVRLKLAFDWKLVPVYDVIAKLPGAELPDQWIVRGNHHDAWVNGATDPTSGMIALMAEAKAIGELARMGFRPRRTLVFAAWDGEEQGLIGSTEWAEAHADELGRKAVVYLNGDSNSRGFVGAGGSHALETMVNEVFDDVTDPQKGVSVAARARALDALSGTPEEQKAARAGKPLALGALGSGSDYTPFLQHLGHRVARRPLRRRGRLRAVPLDLRLDRPLRALHGPRLQLRRRAGAGERPHRAAHGASRRAAVRSDPARVHGRALRRRGGEARRHACARRPRPSAGASSRRSTRTSPIPTRRWWCSQPRIRCRSSTSRRCRTRRRRSPRARELPEGADDAAGGRRADRRGGRGAASMPS